MAMASAPPAGRSPVDQLILASTSRYRADLLRRLGLDFTAVAPSVDEAPWQRRLADPLALCEALATAKAEAVASHHPAAIVIGCDQTAHCGGRILGKAGDAATAVAQLEWLAGRVHDLVTAMVVIQRGEYHRHTDITRLHMRRLDRPALERYIARDAPYDCAGSYKLECAGIALFERIETTDHSAITGLPLIALTSILRRCGVRIP
jgi:septum formation protein